MSQILRTIIYFSVISLTFCEIPSWVVQRPVDNKYYIGIGMASTSSPNYIQTAKNNALNDLSSEISVNISSELVDIMIEKSGMNAEESRSVINASTKADLENYEVMGTWENGFEYWVYYRLSKAKYKAQQELKRRNAISLSLDLFNKGKEKEINWNTKGSTINSAIEYFVQALIPIENYYGDPLETIYNGNKIFLQNEIFSSLQWILSKIKLKAMNPKFDVKTGSSDKKNLDVSASFIDGGNSVIVTNLPIKFSFIRGQGELVETLRTDSKGNVSGEIISISPTQKVQMIKCSLDLTSYIANDNTSDYLIKILENINTPSSKFIINVKGPKVYLESNEYNLGSNLSVKVIEPKIKSLLSKKGYSFTDDISVADVMITIDAESREGSEVYGQFVAFVDATISITNMNSGEEIYKSSIENIKGIQLSFEKAGLKAYQALSKELANTIIPEILDAIK